MQLEDIRGKTIGVIFLATISTIEQLSLNFWCYQIMLVLPHQMPQFLLIFLTELILVPVY
jgi:hypothetical protein